MNYATVFEFKKAAFYLRLYHFTHLHCYFASSYNVTMAVER